MIALRFLAAAAFTAAFVIAAPAASRAEDPVVKHAETPAPSAGPTKAAAEGFCGDPTGTADDLMQRYMGQAGLKEVDKSEQYVTYSDDAKNASVMYNFSTEKNPAHPVAVCRKLVKDGEQMTLKYNVVCGGEAVACAKATSDFNTLIARMQLEVDNQVKAAGGK